MRHPSDGSARARERGFTLIEALVVLAIVSGTLLAFATWGARPPRPHAAAQALAAALAETRALAMANAGVPKRGGPSTGATLSVVQTAASSVAHVYRSRPIPGFAPPVADAGLPPIDLGAVATLPNATTAREPFSIFVSSAGYASVAPNFAYDPANPKTLPNDPGCDESGGAAISLRSGDEVESHALDCRFTALELATRLDDGAVASANGGGSRRKPFASDGAPGR